ncbi:MAG TPA: amino acid adenylation domain-containing protein, partial [Lentisphaeria bacterium]|nr:amino acid adenylation domain-containing protein [Lentisphaeria bacterium]
QHVSIGGQALTSTALANGYEQSPLSLYVREYLPTQDIQLDFSFNLGWFDPADIERLGTRILHLIDGILLHPEYPLGQLDLLPPEERHQLLHDWNATTTPVPDQCIHQMFETQAAARPEATALVFAGEALSYAELDDRANQLAHTLISLGVQPDERIAIALERSPDMIVALLAVLKAGAAYVPLDPDYPAQRLAFMLTDSGAALLITHSTLQQRLGLETTHVVCLDTNTNTITHQPTSNPNQPVAPHHLAYVIYTSGSTGTPKGVMVEHGGLASHVGNVQALYQLSPQDRVLQFASFSFDTALEQILPILGAGGQLVLPPQGLLTIETLDALLRQTGITVLNLPPALFRLWASTCQPSRLPRLILVGGEAMPTDAPALRTRWPKPWPRLCNAYGPTETTITATLFDLPEEWDGATVPIGRAMPGRRLYVLDRHLQPLPIGAAGELFIGGIGLARGYLNRPELTTERFIPDPFAATVAAATHESPLARSGRGDGGEGSPSLPGQKLYRTGDLVRYRPDGNLEFLGRIDQQVKIRGFRIELGEIENALTKHPSIREAVVMAHTDASGAPRLAAHVVLTSGAATGPDELRAFLKASLPDYMLPAAWVFHAALPLTPNGKIDRKALSTPEEQDKAECRQPPRDFLQQQLLQIWEKLLSARPIGIDDHFFQIGGHSLLAVRLVSEIDRNLGKRLPVSRIFEFPTIAGIAALLRQEGWAE